MGLSVECFRALGLKVYGWGLGIRVWGLGVGLWHMMVHL